MKLFVRVAELGSFTAAASELGISQSQASRGVKQLEEHLGRALLLRTTRQLSLTEEGQRYLVASGEVLRSLAEAEASVRGDLPTGRLRVTAPVGFGQRVVAPVIDTLLEEHPTLGVELRLGDRFVDLVAEGLDVAVRLGALEPSSLKVRRLGLSRRALVASPAYLADRAPTSPEDLEGHRLLRYTHLRERAWLLRSGGEQRAVAVAGRRAVDHLPTLRDWVLAGRGIAQLPSWLIEADLDAGRLLCALPPWEPTPLAIHAVFPPTRHRPPRVEAFVSRLATAVSPRSQANSATAPAR